MRLDLYLVNIGIAPSRTRAKEYILNGQIYVNGNVCDKPSEEISDIESKVELHGEKLKYVGRGGLKLEKAINCFNISLDKRCCIDIGASTGGFTDCMLQNRAAFVYAVDVGHGQLDDKIANDCRVKNLEGTNIIELETDALNPYPDFIAADVSFVSLKHILPKVSEIIGKNGEAVLLIKPQFEAGKSFIGKNGIVKDKKVHIRVINDISAFCISIGLAAVNLSFSPITGGSGNIEYLVHILPFGNKIICFDAEKTVNAAFDNFKKQKNS